MSRPTGVPEQEFPNRQASGGCSDIGCGVHDRRLG
jgi:hypothetical protein